MSTLVALLLLAGVAPVPDGARSPMPANDPGTWVTGEDYPPLAEREGEHGTTGFVLSVDADGKVSDCAILVPSGSRALDAATCELASKRARFTPALDGAGRQVAGRYSNRVHWVIPKVEKAPQPGLLMRSFAIEPDGTLSDCLILASRGEVRETFPLGPYPCPTQQRFATATDATGAPVRKRVITTTEVQVEDLP